MPTDFRLKLNAALADKRVQAGGALALAGVAVATIIGGASAWVVNDRAKAQPELADHARLAIQLQQPRPSGAPKGQLEVLDPSQIQAASTPPPSLTPELKALVDKERVEQARMVADQRAFDNRVRAEILGSYRSPSPLKPEPSLATVQTVVGVGAPASPQLRPTQAPIVERAREEEGYRTPEEDSDRYQGRRRFASEDRAPPGYERRFPGYERAYPRDWRDRPPPPPSWGRDDDEDSPD